MLFAIIFLIIEGAFAVRAKNTMTNAIDEAARRGAVAGAAPNADYQILNQLFGRGAATVADVKWVTIYRTTDPTAPVPPACKGTDTTVGSSQPGLCNVFHVDNLLDDDLRFTEPETSFACPGSLGTQWCPEDRGKSGQIEFIGVYVRADYRTILEDTFTSKLLSDVSGNAVQAIETSAD